MEILYNSDNHLTATQEMRTSYNAILESELDRFKQHLTGAHVYISDENSGKNTPNDKLCTIEVKVNGMKNLAVSANGDTVDLAFRGAVEKLASALQSALGKSGRK